jgi:NitT/TauT family transport system ATP-binding protein
MAAIRLQGVRRSYPGGVQALAGLDLEIAPGAFVALLGPSGCGKTTVLRLLAGLDRADAGTVSIDGGGSARPVCSYVFQDPTLMPWATVADNVWLPLRIAGQSRAQAAPRVHAQLQAVGLDGFAQALPHQLSGGMKMRASIARALVTQPELLLLDEPFAALDEITRQRLNHDLLALWRRDRMTCVFVTHSVFEAVFLAERVVVMSARPGRVVADLPIDAPVPRDAGWRMSARYLELAAAASAALESGYGDDAARGSEREVDGSVRDRRDFP